MTEEVTSEEIEGLDHSLDAIACVIRAETGCNYAKGDNAAREVLKLVSPAPSPDNGWLPLVKNWGDARLRVCQSKINTPECAAAITALGAAEDALCKFAATLPPPPAQGGGK